VGMGFCLLYVLISIDNQEYLFQRFIRQACFFCDFLYCGFSAPNGVGFWLFFRRCFWHVYYYSLVLVVVAASLGFAVGIVALVFGVCHFNFVAIGVFLCFIALAANLVLFALDHIFPFRYLPKNLDLFFMPTCPL